MRSTTTALAALATASLTAAAKPKNTQYQNPIIPGFHPDPSCIFVPEWDDTFFCAVSSFIAFPAMPIFASKDLANWKLISHVQNRPSQFPAAGNITRASGGWYAPTLRYHEGTFYVINVDVDAPVSPNGGIFTTTDPYDDAAWSDLLGVEVGGYDPDLFWDPKDGTVYSQAAITILGDPFTTDVEQFTIDIDTGATTSREFLSNGTGVQPPEGPHMYFKDGWYYLLLAEGGTALGHQVTISRSRSPQGPFRLDPANPILTAQGTDSLFQTVGHADLFQDAKGNWWGVALSTRSGPEYVHWPMNRETVLYPVSWPKGKWPVLTPVSGVMSGPLPPQNLDIGGDGPFVKDPDYYTFPPGSAIPKHFTYWRFPQEGKYTVSPPGHRNTLRLLPSNANVSGFTGFDPLDGNTFIARRQTDTLFAFTIDMQFSPARNAEEAGVTIFLTQDRHAVLGLVKRNGKHYVRFRAEGPNAPATVNKEVPASWCTRGVSFEIQAVNFTHYELSAGKRGGKVERIAELDNAILSDSFTGAFVGVYATTNGHGEEGTPAYFSKWRYQGQGQAVEIDPLEYVPSHGQEGAGGYGG